MPKFDSKSVEQCMQVLARKVQRTKMLTSDLAAEAGLIGTRNLVHKLNRRVKAGLLCRENLNGRRILWWLPDSHWSNEQLPVEEAEKTPEPLADEVYRRDSKPEPEPSVPESYEYLNRIARFRRLPNQRVALRALMDSANPVVTGDPHDALSRLMSTARHLYNINGEPFVPAVVELHIAVELKRVVETIETATVHLQEAIETLQELRS